MALALRRLRSEFPALAEDERLEIYDDVWAGLLERRERSGFWPDSLEPYLVGAVVKRARSEHRKRASRRTDPSDVLDESTPAELLGMDERVIDTLDAENYTAIIAALSPLQRSVGRPMLGRPARRQGRKFAMREAIAQDQLSEEQHQTLELVEQADLRAAFNQVLEDRGIPLRVYGFQLGPERDEEYGEGQYSVGQTRDAEPISPDPDVGMPPPGGCYCCRQETVGGPWICYCC